MHGQPTMKFLNSKAVADKTMADYKPEEVSPQLDKSFKDLMAAKANAVKLK